MSRRFPLLFSSRDRRRDGEGRRLRLAFGAIALCCAAAGAAVAWRTGHAQRMLRILWEGDKEGRVRARQLKNVANAREYMDELSAEIEDLWRKVEDDAREIGREAARHKHSKLGGTMSKRVTDVLIHLDRVTGDERVRTARREQVDRALKLGARVREALGGAVADL